MVEQGRKPKQDASRTFHDDSSTAPPTHTLGHADTLGLYLAGDGGTMALPGPSTNLLSQRASLGEEGPGSLSLSLRESAGLWTLSRPG